MYVIDPKKTIRLTLTYPASTGRQFDEILRVIDSLQLGDKNKITTPANWTPGDRVIVHPSVKVSGFSPLINRPYHPFRTSLTRGFIPPEMARQTEDAEKIFKNGVEVVYPYLRFTTL